MKIKFSPSILRKRRIYIVCMIVSSVMIMLFENALERCINDFDHELGKKVVIALLLLTIASLLSWGSGYLEQRIKKEAMFEVQSEWVVAALESPNYEDSGEALFHYTDDLYEMVPWYAIGYLKKNMEIFMVIVLTVYMATINIKMTGITIVLFGLGLLVSKSVSRVFGKVRNQKHKKNARLNQTLIEIIKNLPTIIQLRKKPYFNSYFRQRMNEEYDPSFLKKMINVQAIYISQMVFVQEIIPIFVLFIGLLFAVHGKASIGSVIVMIDLSSRLAQKVQNIAEMLPEKETARIIRKRIQPKAAISAHQKPLGNLQSLQVDVEHFRYPGNEKGILENIHFTIRPGEIWQVKGKSGTGKSTLFHLIARKKEEENFEGHLQYNGEDIQDIDRKEYYKKVLCIEQDPFLFQGTVMENITFGEKYPQEIVKEVMEICGLHHWIGSNGEKTFVENNGKNLSGGEKQRIALARALIKNPELLLIDEGLSGLHPDLRDEIVQHLVEYARQKSMAILTISHNHEFDDIANHTIVIQGERYETARA